MTGDLPRMRTVRAPAQCKATSERVIVSASMSQVGNQVVTRNVPEEIIEVTQAQNQGIRIIVCRDQYPNRGRVARAVVPVSLTRPLFQNGTLKTFPTCWKKKETAINGSIAESRRPSNF